MVLPESSDKMKKLLTKSFWAERDVEIIIGQLLRYGVIISSSIVIIGGLIYLYRHGHEIENYSKFDGEPLWFTSISGVIEGVLLGKGRAIIQLGVIVLIATPILRVAFSALAFLMERDFLYVFISLLVLSIILFSMTGGIAG